MAALTTSDLGLRINSSLPAIQMRKDLSDMRATASGTQAPAQAPVSAGGSQPVGQGGVRTLDPQSARIDQAIREGRAWQTHPLQGQPTPQGVKPPPQAPAPGSMGPGGAGTRYAQGSNPPPPPNGPGGPGTRYAAPSAPAQPPAGRVARIGNAVGKSVKALKPIATVAGEIAKPLTPAMVAAKVADTGTDTYKNRFVMDKDEGVGPTSENLLQGIKDVGVRGIGALTDIGSTLIDMPADAVSLAKNVAKHGTYLHEYDLEGEKPYSYSAYLDKNPATRDDPSTPATPQAAEAEAPTGGSSKLPNPLLEPPTEEDKARMEQAAKVAEFRKGDITPEQAKEMERVAAERDARNARISDAANQNFDSGESLSAMIGRQIQGLRDSYQPVNGRMSISDAYINGARGRAANAQIKDLTSQQHDALALEGQLANARISDAREAARNERLDRNDFLNEQWRQQHAERQQRMDEYTMGRDKKSDETAALKEKQAADEKSAEDARKIAFTKTWRDEKGKPQSFRDTEQENRIMMNLRAKEQQAAAKEGRKPLGDADLMRKYPDALAQLIAEDDAGQAYYNQAGGTYSGQGFTDGQYQRRQAGIGDIFTPGVSMWEALPFTEGDVIEKQGGGNPVSASRIYSGSDGRINSRVKSLLDNIK